MGGGWLLKNDVIGVVVAALAEIPVLASAFFLVLDKDRLRLSLSLVALSDMVQAEELLLDENLRVFLCCILRRTIALDRVDNAV